MHWDLQEVVSTAWEENASLFMQNGRQIMTTKPKFELVASLQVLALAKSNNVLKCPIVKQNPQVQ